MIIVRFRSVDPCGASSWATDQMADCGGRALLRVNAD
jgi:hypothetical protein